MAYVDFSNQMTVQTGLQQVAAPAVPEERLSALEWAVVALARRDRVASLKAPGPLSIALGKVFGSAGRGPHLADPRLEALRRIAVLTWHKGFAIPAREVDRFVSAGFSLGQYETLATSIGISRTQRGAAV
jgi:hypothetical protein